MSVLLLLLLKCVLLFQKQWFSAKTATGIKLHLLFREILILSLNTSNRYFRLCKLNLSKTAYIFYLNILFLIIIESNCFFLLLEKGLCLDLFLLRLFEITDFVILFNASFIKIKLRYTISSYAYLDALLLLHLSIVLLYAFLFLLLTNFFKTRTLLINNMIVSISLVFFS